MCAKKDRTEDRGRETSPKQINCLGFEIVEAVCESSLCFYFDERGGIEEVWQTGELGF